MAGSMNPADAEAQRHWVADYYVQLYSAGREAAMERCLADDYVEHQYTAGFSRDGLAAYVDQRLRDHPDHALLLHHILSDGPFVFLFVEERLGGGVDFARAELFRLEGGRVAEHWGSHVLDEKNRKNDNGTFDGARVDRRLDHARRFGARFEALDLAGFNDQQLDAFLVSRTPEYRQHSPKGGDGRDGLVEILTALKANGTWMTMRPIRSLADGNMLVSHRLYDTDPPHPLINRINTFDVFRLDGEGRAVEHWDVMEEVPSPELLERMF
ncbi:nuclear transport factor 2 family protein [Sphingosinicella terrae]|uniref:nuclear transport factor 2 family protein n=1 Tax=Sphingosinicella terrae TaxID=2172047 RepID=UPI000E0CFDC7|nr:nuclear transport factor 2 family protein [Sphingosinicella terrae]